MESARNMMTHLLLRGNFYAVKLYHGDLIIDDLIPLNPDNVNVVQLPDYTLQYQIYTGQGSLILGQSDVLHIRGLSKNGIVGESVISQARDVFGSALATQEYAGKFWSNDATPAGIIKVAKKLEKGEADRIRDIWNDDHAGTENAHKLHVLGDGASFEKIEMTAPVVSVNTEKGHFMAFIMPERFDINSIPKPSSGKVKIQLVEPRKLATIRFSGYMTQGDYEKNLELLRKTLGVRGISTEGEPLLMQYNDPWTPPFSRRNEIALQVNR